MPLLKQVVIKMNEEKRNNPIYRAKWVALSKAGIWLVWNFIKAAIQSGISTGRLIIWMPKNLQSGLCTLSYSDLNGYPLALLGMMITLTPGTTMVDLDRKSQTMTLHLLNINDKEQIFSQIEQDYIRHLAVWSSSSEKSMGAV